MLQTTNQGPLTVAPFAAPPSPPVVAAPNAWLTMLAAASDAAVDDLLEAAVAWSHGVAGTDAVVRAREDFYARFGKVFPDDAFYDARMSYFFDSFLFGTSGTSSFSAFLSEAQRRSDQIPATVLTRLNALAESRHSIFEIVKHAERALTVLDLVTGQKIVGMARARETFRALGKGQLFQGHVYRTENAAYLSPGIVLHPKKASRLIRKQIRALRQAAGDAQPDASELLARMAQTQIRHLRHRHVDAKVIYAEMLAAR